MTCSDTKKQAECSYSRLSRLRERFAELREGLELKQLPNHLQTAIIRIHSAQSTVQSSFHSRRVLVRHRPPEQHSSASAAQAQTRKEAAAGQEREDCNDGGDGSGSAPPACRRRTWRGGT